MSYDFLDKGSKLFQSFTSPPTFNPRELPKDASPMQRISAHFNRENILPAVHAVALAFTLITAPYCMMLLYGATKTLSSMRGHVQPTPNDDSHGIKPGGNSSSKNETETAKKSVKSESEDPAAIDTQQVAARQDLTEAKEHLQVLTNDLKSIQKEINSLQYSVLLQNSVDTTASRNLTGMIHKPKPVLGDDGLLEISNAVQRTLNVLEKLKKTDDVAALKEDIKNYTTVIQAYSEIVRKNANNVAKENKEREDKKISHLAALETQLKDISPQTDSEYSIRLKQKDSSYSIEFKKISDKGKKKEGTKEAKDTVVAAFITTLLTDIKEMAGTQRGDKQATATLKALQENPVTKELLADHQTTIKEIQQKLLSFSLADFSNALLAPGSEDLQKQFLLTYRESITDKFFGNLKETEPSERLFEWLNQKFKQSDTTLDQKSQILAFAQKWASSPLLNEGDYQRLKTAPTMHSGGENSIPKLQIDKLLEKANKSIYPIINDAADKIGKSLQVPLEKSTRPTDGDQDLSALLTKIASGEIGKKEREKAAAMVADDLRALTTSIFADLRPSEVIHGSWEKKPENSPHIIELQDYARNLTNYIRDSILECEDPTKAIALVNFFGEVEQQLIPKDKASAKPIDIFTATTIANTLAAGPVGTMLDRLKKQEHPDLKKYAGQPDYLADPTPNYTKQTEFIQQLGNPLLIPNVMRSMVHITGGGEIPVTVPTKDPSSSTKLSFSKLSTTATILSTLFDSQEKLQVSKDPMHTNLGKTLKDVETKHSKKSEKEFSEEYDVLVNKLAPRSPPSSTS